MGPRSCERGRGTEGDDVEGKELQWGRVPTNAEGGPTQRTWLS